jgi:hypothetical protein
MYPCTLVLGCSCVSGFQDTLYGPGQRLHNRMDVGDSRKGTVTYRCTVCGLTHGAGYEAAAKVKEEKPSQGKNKKTRPSDEKKARKETRDRPRGRGK